ncbi:hypothetical protein BDN67DRAFT_964358 [Paxillus ammoniavirescens]|nr:hypothetical protein BDN67DRAFT_964358 [Paxillus ammoniavirescens]
MIPLLFASSLLVQLAAAASTNTSSECPACDVTSSDYRSVWSILGSCALTLVICTWNAIHPNIVFQRKRYTAALYRLALILFALVAPEFAVARAYTEWIYAHKIQKDFHEYHWTLTHGFFSLMGGFALHDGTRRMKLHPDDHLQYLKKGTIMNPDITEEEVDDKSKSDGLTKAILVLQLLWFILQVVVRGTNHLAITLVEIDTLAMAALSLPLFFFWWSKPMAPKRPHILHLKPTSVLQNAPQTHCSLDGDDDDGISLMDDTVRIRDARYWVTERPGQQLWQELLLGRRDEVSNWYGVSALSTCLILLGAVHIIAWDFQFPSQAEKITWRIASLTLISAPIIYLIVRKPDGKLPEIRSVVAVGMVNIGLIARCLLLVLMLASLRDLPPSAHETVSWTTYIPHL